MTNSVDRLYDLMPAIYRLRDADQGYPLRALLRVITEQVNLVEADISQLYDNWFIETCQEWVVPYIGGLIGYTPIQDAAQLGNVSRPRQINRESILIPRAEVANTIRFRRRKGTLSLLEGLAAAVSGWPAHAVEFFRLLGVTQNINYLQLKRGRTQDVRAGYELEQIGGAFDQSSYTIDVRRVDSAHTPGFANIPEVGLFIWRLKTYSVTRTPAYCYEEEGPSCYMFSVLGNDTQLYNNPQSTGATAWPNAGELSFPTPICRRSLQPTESTRKIKPRPSRIPLYYGAGKSFDIFVGHPDQAVPADQIVAADLSDWSYRPLPNQVAVDPKLGRIAFPPGQARKQGVWVSYYYGFSADLGGGEYDRPLSQAAGARFYYVGDQKKKGQAPAAKVYSRINDALAQWRTDQPQDAVIEILDSGVYVEPINVSLKSKQTLQIRAANRVRPILRLLDWQTSEPDDLTVTGEKDTWFIVDGILITGRGIEVSGEMSGVAIRHSTLVPGWGVHCNCEPKRASEPSLELVNSPACVTIDHSIIGAIQVDRSQVKDNPLLIHITDSVLDATSPEAVALGAPEKMCADAVLTIERTTVFGQVQTQTIALAQDSIFMGQVLACRRQKGCMRFCYVPPGSRTPARYECQPDLVRQAVTALYSGDTTAKERNAMLESEQLRVKPEFNAVRYGKAQYCQLDDLCAVEIKTGASDESEMGVFHDLYQPQRANNLQTRLNDYTPGGTDAGIIFAS